MTRTLLFSPARVDQMVVRLAYEVVEKNRGSESLVVLGILTRGAHIARTLAAAIQKISGVPVECRDLDISAYRDDIKRNVAVPSNGSHGRADVTDRDVLLVDDVLYTGRTVRAALDAVVDLGRPRSIQLAVLIDRGHREYPIQPTFVGRSIQTKYRERVDVEAGEGISVFLEE